MATLAEVLRQTGYSKDGVLAAPTPTGVNLSSVAKNYIASIPQELNKNLTQQRFDIENALKLTREGGIEIADQAAFNRFMEQAPNAIGSIKKLIGPLTRMDTAQLRAALPYKEGGLNLPTNNTPMQRARAMGFETAPNKELYHGSRGELTGNIDPSKSDYGFHVGTLEQAENRLKTFGNRGIDFPEGANIAPMLKSKYADFLNAKDKGSFNADELVEQFKGNKNIDQGAIKKIADMIAKDERPATREVMNEYNEMIRNIVGQQGYKGLKYMNKTEGEGLSYAVSDPSVLRSRFAAFDPYMEKSPNPMAAGLVLPMGDEENRRQTLERLFNKQK
jgi:hypothetical protein